MFWSICEREHIVGNPAPCGVSCEPQETFMNGNVDSPAISLVRSDVPIPIRVEFTGFRKHCLRKAIEGRRVAYGIRCGLLATDPSSELGEADPFAYADDVRSGDLSGCRFGGELVVSPVPCSHHQPLLSILTRGKEHPGRHDQPATWENRPTVEEHVRVLHLAAPLLRAGSQRV